MKFFSGSNAVLMAATILLAGLRADAQGFGLGATASTNFLNVNDQLVYTINLTNQSGTLLNLVSVTNTFSSSVTIVAHTQSHGSSGIDGSSYVFIIGQMTIGEVDQMTLTVQATSAGFLTNAITAANLGIINPVSTNLVAQVVDGQADLGVAVFGPAQAVITNDLTSYSVGVTNFGPGSAPGVMLTNTLPAGVTLKSASLAYSTSGSNMLFNLGTLASGSNVLVQLFIQPTNEAVLNFSASVGAANVVDSNLTNNFASTNVPVTGYLAGTIIAVTNSPQITNPQNGLKEQYILLTNAGTNDAPAVRLVVSGLTNRLVNAVGTNGSSPFVIYSAALPAGKSAKLLLQYFPRGGFPFTNGQLQAYAVTMPDWTPPAATAFSTNENISRIVTLASGSMLIEFPSLTNRTYTMVYSDNVQFSNAMIAPPAIVPTANRTQWIDYGPPGTVSAPTNASVRFYRVFLNP